MDEIRTRPDADDDLMMLKHPKKKCVAEHRTWDARVIILPIRMAFYHWTIMI
jgi:hypothetical protein